MVDLSTITSKTGMEWMLLLGVCENLSDPKKQLVGSEGSRLELFDRLTDRLRQMVADHDEPNDIMCQYDDVRARFDTIVDIQKGRRNGGA